MNQKIIVFILFSMVVFYQACKKDTPNESKTETIVVSNDKWTKTSSYEFKGEVFDFKVLENGNLALLSQNYYVFDSNFNMVYSENLLQNILDFSPKKLSNPFYTNQRSSIENKQYLNLNYFDNTTGIINSKIITEPKSLIDISDNGYAILLDDKEDKIFNRAVKLFLKTEFDSATSSGKQYNVFTGNDINSKKRSFEKTFENRFSRIATTKKGYLLYSLNSTLLRFLDLSLMVKDTNVLRTIPEKVFSNDNYFFIQNNYGVYKTENGENFQLITNDFEAKCMVNDSLIYGVRKNKPSVLNLLNGNISELTTNQMNTNKWYSDIEAMSINNKIILFTENGVYQLKL